MDGEALKTAPKGYDAEHPAIDLLKHKRFIASRTFADADLLKPDFAAQVVETCSALKPFEAYFHAITQDIPAPER
jgi:uncharacterized protein (DUF2461 family)